MIYCMMREETKDTHKPPQIKKVALDVFRGYFLFSKNHVQLLRKQMEKEAFENITDGRVCMTDSEEVRAYRRSGRCAPHLSGG